MTPFSSLLGLMLSPAMGFWPDFQNQAGIPVYGADLKSRERTIGYPLNTTGVAHVCPSAWQAGL